MVNAGGESLQSGTPHLISGPRSGGGGGGGNVTKANASKTHQKLSTLIRFVFL